jgi:hypothetical protein
MPILKYFPSYDFIENFFPIKKYIPSWFKDTPLSYGDKITFTDKKSTFKVCTPFLDAFTTGYAISLPGDIICEYDDTNGPHFTWGQPDVEVVTRRPLETLGQLPCPKEFYPIAFAWKTNLSISIPKGYSALLTHPLNRVDLPFYTLSGVIDSFDVESGNIPFFLKQGFTGLIPMDTPIVQIILFKRENWKSNKDPIVKINGDLNRRKSTSLYKGWYKTNIWQRKTYE